MKGSRTLVELLRARAREVGERAAFRWLQDGEREKLTLSYRDLDHRARTLASALAERSAAGDRALLVFAPGVDFIAAFFGCLYAGIVAVPVYPPRRGRDLSRLFGVLQDAQPKCVLTTRVLRKRMERQVKLPQLARIGWLEIDKLDASLAESWRSPHIDLDTLAFLQYTSGSTSAPKGVKVHHGHLLHNEAMIQQAFGQTEASQVVSWLPLYHDMGLIGGVLQPLFLGASCVLMSPAAFLKRPSRWLQAIDRYRATTSGGPNFAYDLCTHRIPQEDLEGLDLSSWRVAFNGSEPVRAETLERFSERFSVCGFSQRSFYPCYGLAEATLFVSGGEPGSGPVVRGFDAESLDHGLARPTANLAKPAAKRTARQLVGCGRGWMEQRILAVDPQTRIPLRDGAIGEIWVAGPSVAGGYWRREKTSAETFGARLASGEGPFLRTGDLGFLEGGDVFVTGRLKDLIILRGRNLYPQDIERTVETSYRGLRLGCGAAFSIDVAGEERLVVVQEIDPKVRDAKMTILESARRAVAEVHQAALHELVLVPPHTVPKTSSGKIQRRLCRKLHASGELPIWERLGGDGLREVATQESSPSEFDAWILDQLWDLPFEARCEDLCGFLLRLGERHLGRPMTATASYLQQGMDSLQAVSLQHEIETTLGIELPMARLLEGPPVERLAAELVAELERSSLDLRPEGGDRPAVLAGPKAPKGTTVGEHPTTPGQQALLALEHRARRSAALHVSAAIRLLGVDVERLLLALEGLVVRHPALRTSFRTDTAEPVQIVCEDGTFEGSGQDFLQDATGLSEYEFGESLAEEAHRPFDLGAGPLMRCRLFKRSEETHVLLWVVHHLVCDLWSWNLMVRDLSRLYRDPNLANRSDAIGIELDVRFSDHVRWQRLWLDSEVGVAHGNFWQDLLRNLPEFLDFPTDRPYQALQSFRGARIVQLSDRDLRSALERYCQESGLTLYTALMTAYQALLFRYTGQTRLVVGSPMAGRRRADVSEVVGYFVNLVPIAGDFRHRPSFRALLERTRATVLAALEHQDYPLPRMVERLLPSRRDFSRPPIFQTLFVLQSAVAGDASLGAFALGLPGVSLDLAGLRAESMELAQRGSQFEFTLTVAEVPDGLAFSLLYATDLFDEVRMRRLMGHFETLLWAALDEPERPLSELPLLSQEEEGQLRFWGGPRTETISGPVLLLDRGFEHQARRTPDAVALVEGAEMLTYGALDMAGDHLASDLRALGVSVEDRVGLCLGRTSRMIVGILAILKSGGAYVPLDPQHPEERLRFVLEDADPKVLLTEQGVLNRLPWLAETRGSVIYEHIPPSTLSPSLETTGRFPDRAAYLIYTSGSTGRPKGVVVSHRNVQGLMSAARNAFALDQEDIWTLFHAITFDFSVWEIWGALLHGGRLVIVPYDVSRSPDVFRRLLSLERVTILSQTPTAFRQLVQADQCSPDPQGVRCVIFGGEALDPTSLDPWVKKHGDQQSRLINLYGITETTVHVTHRQIARSDLDSGFATPLGPPLDGWSVQLLDPHLQPLPVGVPGEICVGGAGLARGYHRRPSLTAARFVPNARSAAPGARLYRSGDRARFDFTGELVYLGRLDHQVKIRGFRIELGEIEAALENHPAVRDAVVLARRDEPGEARLVAYWVGREGAEGLPTIAEFRRFLEQTLPEYMVPSAFIQLAELPLTGNGKLDRRALPAPGAERPDLEVAYQAPRNAAEEALVSVWSEVLGVERVGIDDSYFALGGDSIRSIRVQALMRERGYELAFENLYRLQTVRELAPQLGRVVPAAFDGIPEPFALVSDRDRKLLPTGLEDAFPLTSVQTGMIYQSETHPDYEIYVTSLHLWAPLRPDLLAQALLDLARCHPILRTSFELALFSQPLQLVWDDVSVPLSIIDLRALPGEKRQAIVDGWLNAERRRNFIWGRAPLFRLTVHHRQKEGGGKESFQLTLSEPFFDGWSVGTFLTELIERYLTLYRAEKQGDPVPSLSSLASSYRQFVALEQAVIESPSSQKFWDGVLDGADPSNLPKWTSPKGRADLTRSSAIYGIRVERYGVPIEEWLSEGLIEVARRLEVPLKNVLLAAHVKTLSLLTGQRQPLTGLLENGRPETRDGERLLGLFLNAVCFRLNLRGQSFAELAQECLIAEHALLPHRRMPLAALQQKRGSEALFDTVFNYTHFHIYQGIEALPEVALVDAFASEQTYYDLTSQFNRDHVSGRLRLVLDYRAARFDAAQIQTIGQTYQRVLQLMANAPGLPENTSQLLSDAEKQALLVEWQDSDTSFQKSLGLHREFERRVSIQGCRRALFTPGESLDYVELNRRANRLARRWLGLGMLPEEGVAIHMERSPSLVIALLAVLKNGAFYIPLDPAAPRERSIFMLQDSGARWLVADRETPLRFPQASLRFLDFPVEEEAARCENDENLDLDALPQQAAYLIYTSGSTGRPKGVVGLHGSTLNRLRFLWRSLPYGMDDLGREEVACQKTFFSFVDAVAEIFAPLLAGVPSLILDDETVRDHERFVAALAEAGVTRLVLVPSLLRVLLSDPELSHHLPRLRFWFTSGEALPVDLVRRFHELLPGRRLFNIYGSSEVAADVTWHEARPHRQALNTIPIGRPIANHAVRVLDRDLHLVKLGAEGQITVSGVGLARGYFARPSLSAERFVPDPFAVCAGERLYLTGDLGCFRPDGELILLGRCDQQLKIRGMRVEPGEVEAVLLAHPEVRAAVVRTWEGTQGVHLVAYVVPFAADAIDTEELRILLREQVPGAFLPDAFVLLEHLPLTPSGKLDQRLLPAPDLSTSAEFVAPRSATEEVLAGIWSEVLGLEKVGVGDDFHALGGHSLLATQVISRLRQAFDVELPLSRLFVAPTIDLLAREIERAQRGTVRPPLIATSQRSLLSFAQQRLCFIDRMAPGDPVYNLPGAVRLVGRLEIRALEQALAAVVARHEVLRTHFVTVGTGFEPSIDARIDLPMPLVDLSSLPKEKRHHLARQHQAREVRRPFDLGCGPLLRALLIRLANDDHEFLLTLHHVVSDGWSQGVLIKELITHYRAFCLGEQANLPALPVQYGDFAHWQRGWLGAELERLTCWWREQLGAQPPVLHLPTDFPRPAELSSRGGVIRRRYDATFFGALKGFARSQNCSLFMTLMAAFEVVMHHASDQDDLVIGTDVANRDQVELEGLIGFFVNQLLLRFSVAGDPTFLDLLERTRMHTLGVYAHQDLPFDKLVEAINPPRERNRTPLFQIKFVLQNTPQPPLNVPGLTVTPLEVDTRTAKFDQLWNLWERDGELSIAVEYSSDLFLAKSVERLLDLFRRTLEILQENPELPLSQLRRALHESEEIWKREREERWRQASRGRFRKLKRKAKVGFAGRPKPVEASPQEPVPAHQDID